MERKARDPTDRGCVVYSIGSNGDFNFELGVQVRSVRISSHRFDIFSRKVSAQYYRIYICKTERNRGRHLRIPHIRYGKFRRENAQGVEEGTLSSMGSQKPRPELHAATSTVAFVVQEAAVPKRQNASVGTEVLRAARYR